MWYGVVKYKAYVYNTYLHSMLKVHTCLKNKDKGKKTFQCRIFHFISTWQTMKVIRNETLKKVLYSWIKTQMGNSRKLFFSSVGMKQSNRKIMIVRLATVSHCFLLWKINFQFVFFFVHSEFLFVSTQSVWYFYVTICKINLQYCLIILLFNF